MKTFAQVIWDDRKKFEKLFDLSANEFMDNLMSVTFRRFSIDIVKLDKWFETNKGYDIDKDGSTADFVRKTYGDEAVKFIEDHI